jgi:hypothetical protein
MTTSPRLLAAATLLAPLVLLLATHTAHGATRPTVRFTSAPASVTAARTATLGIARTAPRGHVRAQSCRIDRAPWRPCTRSFALRGLVDGVHTARVRLVLRGGATAAAAATWRVDTVEPSSPAALGGSDAWTSAASRVVSPGIAIDPAPASGVASYHSRISTDGGATWTPGPEGAVTVSAEGQTLVQIAAVDLAGNASPWSASAVVRIDRTAPDAPAIAGAPDGWTNVDAVQLAIAGSDVLEHQLSTDGGLTWTWPQAGATADVTAEGETLVRARACDAAGNCSVWSGPVAVRIDRTAPGVPAISGAPDGWTSAAEVVLAIAGDAALDHQESADGGATWSPAGGGATVDVTAEGQTLVRARSCDQAGNCSTWSEPVRVRIDRTPPTAPLTVTGGDGGDPSCLYTETQDVVFAVAGATDDGAGVDHYVWRLNRFNETPLAVGGQGSTVHLTYAQAMLSVRIRFAAVDAAGNVGPWSDGTLPGANICLFPAV